MLEDEGVEFTYRDYRQEPLSVSELGRLFKRLGVAPKTLLRKRDKAYKELGLTGNESDKAVIAHMAEHPTLLERPIGVSGERAVVGRPPERLLELGAEDPSRS